MLRDNLYRLLDLQTVDGLTSARVTLLPESPIYAAHFRGMPVTPGACLVEMACELASLAAGRSLELASASDIKFLAPVLPGQTSGLTFLLEGNPSEATPLTVRILDGEMLHARMKLSLC